MKLITIFLAALAALSILAPAAFADDAQGFANTGTRVTAKVLSTEESTVFDEDKQQYIDSQSVQIEVLTRSNLRGRQYKITNRFPNEYSKQANTLKKGDRIQVLLYFSEEGRLYDWQVLNRVIYHYAVILSVLFVALLAAIGRKKGLKAALSLVLTILLVIFVMIPLLKAGFAPVPVTVLVCLAVTAVTMFIISGFSSKSYAAILGTLAGLAAAWALSAAVAYAGNMTAITTEEVEMLIYNPQGLQFDLKGIMLSGILIGCLGAVMDVAMSISSSVHQVKAVDPAMGRGGLFQSGMEVGCDVIGTMANTLILAYTGSALVIILVQATYGLSIVDMLNHDFILEEVLRSLAGSIGMILSVPATALLASLLLAGKREGRGDH